MVDQLSSVINVTTTLRLWHVLVTLLGGAGVQRILTDIARAMPPLPANSGYFARWAYGAIQLITGHEIK